ncbi:MAG: hypothetical protein IKP00_03165 [Victivallales bacterium]|nr:hypothetical protein [Victivallales bacterium]
MIPSDHFVRFYNEVFKFLDKNNGLEEYYLEISRHQEGHCYQLFMEKGLEGMEEYWGHIRVEENCVSSSYIKDGVRYSEMNRCPSLSKVLDCDATPCEKYCLHCPGWVIPLMTKCGFYFVDYIIGLADPRCRAFQTEYREKAQKIIADLIAEGHDPDMIFSNVDNAEEVEANKAYRHSLLANKALGIKR